MAKKKRKPYNKSTGRNYAGYDRSYESTEKQKKHRAMRNAAREIEAKAGKVHKGDGMDVDHKQGVGKGNAKSNLQVLTKSKNRAKH